MDPSSGLGQNQESGRAPAAAPPSMLVMKFGGSSLAGAEAIDRVCSIVESRSGSSPLVVVSAVGDTTDRLLEAAEAEPGEGSRLLESLRHETEALARAVVPTESVGAYLNGIFQEAADLLSSLVRGHGRLAPSAALDAVLACGERISSRLVALALRERGVRAMDLDSRQLFVTEACHGGAAALFEPTRERLRTTVLPLLDAGRLPVVGGFIASSEDGAPTTLGRGGSDYTASLAGAALAAEEVQIWTDVDGVMTADPSLIDSARPLPRLSLREASELAYFGGRVLHPSTMLPAIEHGIPIRVLNSKRPDVAGTLILKEATETESVVKSVVYKENITLIDVHSTRMLMAHGFLAKIFEVFARHETAVDMVSTSEVSVSLTVDQPGKLPEILGELASFAHAEATPGKAIVCVVGEGIRYTPGIAARVFQALDGIRIRMISLGASRVNVGFVVDHEDLERAVRRLHAACFPQPWHAEAQQQ